MGRVIKTPEVTKGTKHDQGKPPISLIPRYALEEEAKVMGYGLEKYGRDNWRKGWDWSRCSDAILRHMIAFNSGEDLDPETGISHLAHIRCNAAFLLEFTKTHPDLDDRHTAL